MKIGYSNLLGEYLKAEEIDYADCKGFQVVCPICREPVFKVSRAGEMALHYLAHYAAQKSFATDCELRVGGINSGDVEGHNHASRGQRLTYFLGVLRRVVSQKCYSKTGEKEWNRLHRRMGGSPELVALKVSDFTEKYSHRELFLSAFEGLAGHYIEELAAGTYRTEFSMSIQVQIAKDMMASLLTTSGRENFYWLWDHAYLAVIARSISDGGEGGSSDPIVHAMNNLAARLAGCNRGDGKKIIRAMAGIEMFPADGDLPARSMLQELRAEISQEMVGCLILLPYFDLLKEAKL